MRRMNKKDADTHMSDINATIVSTLGDYTNNNGDRTRFYLNSQNEHCVEDRFGVMTFCTKEAAVDRWNTQVSDFMKMRVQRYTVEAGRLICRDGKPYISINAENGNFVEADDAVHLIAGFLNSL